MNFGHTEIFVKEPLKAKDFYENILGLKLMKFRMILLSG